VVAQKRNHSKLHGVERDWTDMGQV
jgi:hypothetical protein